MVKTGMLLLLLGHFVPSVLLIDVTVYPKHGSVSGVFHVSLYGGYALNASAARDVCESLGVTIADKAQVEKALAHGFETCKFGWIDEQVAVIPRIQSKESCGKGSVGIITWRANLSFLFDVFCFNLTDYEAHVNAVHENPSTTTPTSTSTPGAHTSGRVHPKMAKTTSSASPDDLKITSSTSYSPVKDTPESQPISNTSPTTAVGLIALLTTVFSFLLLAVAAVCYFKKNSVGQWNKSQQKESGKESGNTGKESQDELKSQHKMTPDTNDVSVVINPENETGDQTERPAL